MEAPRGIAIVGMACRFPGAPDLDAFWEMLLTGREGIRHFTDDELLAAGVPETDLARPDYVKSAPVIEGYDLFDAGFFEYSPREARIMDPQQRLLLECAWHALEDAGHDPARTEEPVGAFIGTGGVVSSYLLAQAALHGSATGGVEHLGNDKDFAATRLAYKLGLTGPALNVQTACSTGLVAVHLARQSILEGECRMALAGCATVRVPQVAGYRYREGDILSPDGHCRAYDADAKGTVFGSGVGVVVLKHVEDALADGDRIYAVLRGSAINNDGAGKVSFTASSADGQARCMAEAFGVAEVAPASLGLIEGHGTGTVVGDPLEVQALARCMGGVGAWLGSVKTNIGHLEQTAGIASLIKTALAVHHARIPPSLHFETPNPRIAETPFRVPVAVSDWPNAPRRAGINSLGLGGTNAFAVLEQAPEPAAQAVAPYHLLTLSAKTPEALAETASRWRDWLHGAGDGLADACSTAAAGRAEHPHRLAVTGSDAPSLAAALERAQPEAGSTGRIAFVFPGQGAQYAGMGSTLYREEPVYRAAFDRIADHLAERGLDVSAAMDGPEEALADTRLQQPALFAVGWALAELLRHWGVVPGAVLGHSVGSFAAGAVAGFWTPEDAATLIAERARLMGDLPAGGSMSALFCDESTARQVLAPGSAIAALNGPESTTISGSEPAIAATEQTATAAGIPYRRLRVSHAFHSPLVTPAAEALGRFAATIPARPPRIPFVSDHSGARLTEAPGGAYLSAHMLQPVRFADGLAALAAEGVTDLIELGPGSALRGFAAGSPDCAGMRLHGLLAHDGDWPEALATLGRLWARGHGASPATYYRDRGARRTSAPLTPFQRQRYWLDNSSPRAEPSLLGEELRTPGPARQFQARWSADRQPWLADHRVHGALCLPLAAALIAFSEGGAKALGERAAVTDLTYARACLWDDDEERLLHTEIAADGSASLSSFVEDWVEHLTATVRPGTDLPSGDLAAIRARCPDPVEPARFYAVAVGIGLNYGPGFRAVRELWLGDGAALGRIRLGEIAEAGAALHPALLDACLHLFPALSGRHRRFEGAAEGDTFLPISVERFVVSGPAPPEVWSHCALRPGEDPSSGRFTLDVHVMAPDGTTVARIDGLTVRQIPRAEFLPRRKARVEDWLYRLDWQVQAPLPEPVPSGRWLIVADASADAAPVAAALAGAEVEIIETALLAEDPGAVADALGDAPLKGVVLATALSQRPLMLNAPDDLTATSETQFAVCQALVRLMSDHAREGWEGPRLHIVTQGAQSPVPDRIGGEAMQAALWGQGMVIALEHPGIWGGLIDLDDRADPDLLARELTVPDGEDRIALRDGRRYAARLVRSDLGPPPQAAVRADRSYLITGGLGTLGLKTARWLSEWGARHLWLVSRRAPTPEQEVEIAALDATVHTAQGDVTDAQQVALLVAGIEEEGPPLDGVFHCAGLLDDGIIGSMSVEQYQRVTAPKIAGSWALHQATEDLELGHFVIYSSILSLIGSMGQLNYVAGNAFQDALAAHRQRLGLPATVLNWGPWEEAGLATASGEKGRAIWRARGTEYIPADEGIAVLDHALGHRAPHLGVTITDWSRFLGQFPTPPRLYAELGAAPVRAEIIDAADVRARLAAATDDERVATMGAVIGSMAARTLGLDAPPDPALSLRAAGLDSLMSVTLINDIEAAFGPRLPAREMLRGPSVEELAAMVLERMALPSPVREKTTPASNGRTGQWLVTARPRPEAEMRLFCFPFAGGGSAVFDRWGEAFDPCIEIVAVEPPGRLGRIAEAPVRKVEAFTAGLLPQMLPMLDRPYAVLGHCLGGLTLYETLRALRSLGRPMPAHIFVSGARPPSVLRAAGSFEAELEERLRAFGGYRTGRPGHEQTDPVFVEIVRAFGITESLKMLEEEELRALILPTVRAEFEMASRYMYLPDRPFAAPITCFRGARDAYVDAVDARIWRKFTSKGFELFTRDVGHFAIVEDFDFIRQKVEERLLGACAESA